MFVTSATDFSIIVRQILVSDRDLLTIVFLFALIFLSFAFALDRKKMLLLPSSLFSDKYYSQLTRESRLFQGFLFPCMAIFIILIQALALFVLLKLCVPYLARQLNSVILLTICIAAVFLNYLLVVSAIQFYTYLFDYKEDKIYYFSYHFFRQTTNTLLLFVFLLIFIYSPYPILVYIFIPFYVITFGIFFLKLIGINHGKQNLFLFFMYFCTLEILPYLWIAKSLYIIENQFL